MREYPWHLRLPTHEHYKRFFYLHHLHELTQSWIREAEVDPPPVHSKGTSIDVTENLWMLDLIHKGELEVLLDDTSPNDILNRLERTVWAYQSLSLVHLYGRTLPNKTSLDTILEQSSWKMGKNYSELQWNSLSHTGSQDLRDILLALNDSPFAGYPTGDSFLVRRAISTEVQIELRSCPHRVHFPEIRGVEDRLCRLHAHWMRGFGYSLNNRVSVQHLVQSPRCTQRWFFP